IDPGAVEIAKLRLWLSLIVDEDEIKNIKPLPNLDYKIVRGNSLIGFPENWISPISKEIEDLKNEFFSETNPSKKTILKKHIDDKLNYRYENSLKTFGYNIDFDFKMVFSEVFHHKAGFDVVIANPPYEEISEKTRKTYFQKNYPDVLSGHYDLYIFFFRKAFIAAKVTGLISFITPHTYLHYTQFRNLRKYIYENSQIIEITNRISGIFESAVVDNSIIFLKTGIASNDYSTRFVSKYIGDGALLDERTFNLNCSDFDPESFDINAIRNRKIIKRYSKNTLPLGKITESTQGIIVYAKEQGRKVDRFSERRLNKNYRPVVKGRDFSKYFLRWSGKYIEYGEWLCRSRDPIFFESRKLFFRQTADSIIGTYVERSMYCVDSVHSFILLTDKNEYDLRYILAILNSTLGNYFYKLFITETGKVFARVKLTYLRRLPIKVATRWIQEPLIAMVDRIIAITKDEDYLQNPQKQKKVKTLEREIDQVVYKIYSLTSEEIKIVENS
ncbi:MAG: Eco57I restriction-modification methylase domain-containing protein, partial [Calditrichia bacterium]|nr:Eco57I restriction-modification methylase domain-containing protein [Calditrichia bacterium]